MYGIGHKAGAAATALFAAAGPAAAEAISTVPAAAPSGVSQEQALALTARLDALERRNDELEAEVADLKKQSAAQAQLQARAVKEQVQGVSRVTVDGGRPTIASADGRFSASLHAIMQLDAAAYDQAKAGPLASDLRRTGPALGASASNVDLTHARELKSGDLFRRARIGIDGTVYGDWDYRVLLDFGGAGVENAGQVYETWLQYDGLRPWYVRVGAFAPSLGLEDQGSNTAMPFLERSTAVDLSRSLAAGETRTAAQLFGFGKHWLAAVAVTGRTVGVISTGTGAGTPQTYGDQLGYTARLAATPFHGKDWLIHLGVNASYVDRPANTAGPSAAGPIALSARSVTFSDTPEIRVDATKLINTGAIPARHADSRGGEFAFQWRNLLLQSEAQSFEVQRSDGAGDPHFGGYYVLGTWILTGERRTYNIQTAAFDAPPVAHPFSLRDHGWGAWELAARWSDTDLNHHAGAAGTLPRPDAVRGGEEQNLSLALNWFWNPFARVMLDYQHVRIDRLSPAVSASVASSLWQTPVGAPIGQAFDVWSVRTQFAF